MKASSIPIIEVRGALLVSLQKELNDQEAIQLQDDIMHRLQATHASGVVVDVTAVEIIDSFIARLFNDIGQSANIMGSHAVLVGLKPAVAMTLVEMCVELGRIQTALGMDEALEWLEARQAA